MKRIEYIKKEGRKMKCQNCKQNPATIHLHVNQNGNNIELNLCSRCYKALKNQQGGGRMMNNFNRNPFGFGDFDDIFRQMYGNQEQARQVPPTQASGGQQPPQNDSLLGQYGTNLNQLAREGKIDPVIGRDNEITRVVEILNRRRKNNPVLIGEAGVGKTAIAEGLALKIVEEDVPEKLRDKEIIRLDVASLVQGTGIRGQFEERMQQLIDEVTADDSIILFIDEIHELVGAGTADGSNMDAGNILKPALARGELQLIGATTLNEYREIEKDAALERRFQPVMVDEPSIEEAIQILKGIQKYYENYHHVKYTDKAIEDAVELSARYIQDRQLPDKAIDLLDEAGSKKNLTLNPVDTDAIKQKIMEAEQKKNEATEKENFEDAAYYRDQMEKYGQMLTSGSSDEDDVEVTAEDIIEIIEQQTGIPVAEIQEQEQKQLKDLAKNLKENIIGQDEAIEQVSRAIQRSRVGLKRPGRPIGSFLFVGPTGVGKTETAKVLAEELFGTRDSYVRLDMSEFMDKHSTSKLIGSPPGYVGYDEAGQLTETVRHNPYSLILVDEVEKAHPDVLNIFLQIMEDGRLTDSKGRTVSFENTIIIMTSNAGSGNAEANVGFGAQAEGRQNSIKDQLTNYFRPEFLNRFTAIVEFTALTKEELLSIVDLMIADVNKLLARQDMSIDVSDEVKKELTELGYNPDLGARPLRRVIEEQIEDRIAEYYLNQGETNHMKAVMEDGQIVVKAADDEDSSSDTSEEKEEENTKDSESESEK